MAAHFIRPNGWIAVKYHGPDNAEVEIGLSVQGPAQATWKAAYFDYEGTERIVTIQQPGFRFSKVFLRVNGEVQK